MSDKSDLAHHESLPVHVLNSALALAWLNRCCPCPPLSPWPLPSRWSRKAAAAVAPMDDRGGMGSGNDVGTETNAATSHYPLR